MTKENVKQVWDYIQSLLDLDGDVWMGAFTATVIFRLIYAALGHAPMTTAEASAYAAAIGSFAYSNRGPKQS